MSKYIQLGKRLILPLLLVATAFGVAKSTSYVDNETRKHRIDSYYETAQEVRKAFLKGNLNEARERQQYLWDEINQDRRNGTKDIWGRLTDKDIEYLESSLHSTNVLSKKQLVKPKL